jgi:hypothetical protein
MDEHKNDIFRYLDISTESIKSEKVMSPSDTETWIHEHKFEDDLPVGFTKTDTDWWYKIGQRNSIIRKMAEFISKRDIDEAICKNVPIIESEECKKCEYTYGDIHCGDCSEFYESNCPYEDCVDCIINYFEKLE